MTILRQHRRDLKGGVSFLAVEAALRGSGWKGVYQRRHPHGYLLNQPDRASAVVGRPAGAPPAREAQE